MVTENSDEWKRICLAVCRSQQQGKDKKFIEKLIIIFVRTSNVKQFKNRRNDIKIQL